MVGAALAEGVPADSVLTVPDLYFARLGCVTDHPAGQGTNVGIP